MEPLERLGYNPERVLARDGIADWLHGAPDDWVPVPHVGMALARGARTTGDAHFGFWLAEQSSISRIPLIGRVISQSDTVYDALKRTCRVIRYLNSGLHIWLAEDDDSVWIRRAEPPGLKIGREPTEQYVLGMLVQLAQLGLGPNWTPARVMVYAPDASHVEDWHTFADAGVLANRQCTAIAVPRSVLATRIKQRVRTPHRDPTLQLIGREPARDFVGSLREVVAAHLSAGALDIETAAEIAGTSSRSLKRWLARDDLTYRELVAQVRFRTATRLLRDPDIPVREIAHDLGYANAPHFSRAFRRWAGVTPGAYRQHLLTGTSSMN